MIESWRSAWRAAAKHLSLEGLEALRKALTEDDVRLAQGYTIDPPPLTYLADWPVESACPLAYTVWQGDGLETVVQVEEEFARLCWSIDEELNAPAACCWLICWWDDNPRQQVRCELLIEVQRSLAERLASAGGATAAERDSVRRAAEQLRRTSS